MSGIKENLLRNTSTQANTAFLQELKTKLPQYFTSEKIETVELEDGQTESRVLQEAEFNIEKFLADLQKNNISESRDGYRLSFVGKDYARLQTGLAPETVIVPDIEHNKKDENKDSQNVFITGDNLEALRHLQNAYSNAIKMIYIDPPYNTNKEFVYNDKFEFSDENLKSQLGYTDEEIARLKSIQGKSSHSAWLTFMYPRLKIAQKLLRDDGVIFVSIDDNEQANLKLLMDDVFGEGNFIATLPTIMNLKGNNDQFGFAGTHEYIIVSSKNISLLEDLRGLPLDEDDIKTYNLKDDKGFYKEGATLMRTGEAGARDRRPHGYYPIYVSKDLKRMSINKIDTDDYEIFPKTKENVEMSWRRSPNTLQKSVNEFIIKKTTTGISFYKKQRLDDDLVSGKKPKSLFYKPEYSSGNGTALLKHIFGDRFFDNPKPISLIKDLIKVGSCENDIILDFFAGSGTTADAVMQLNTEDGGNRKYIMVQWGEPTNKDSTARKAGYQSIDQISRERIKRAAAKIRKENESLPENIDLGFKHYRLATPQVQTLEQIETFDPNQQDLFTHDMLQPFSATALQVEGLATGVDTLLQTWLISDGYTFDTPIEILDLAGYQAFYQKDAQSLYLLAADFKADCLKALLNQIGQNKLLVSTIILYPYSFSFEELHQLKTNLKTNLDHAPKIIERF